MHSKKLYAWETGLADDLSLVLLCGEQDFKLAANTITIDRKIRYQVSPKVNIALKILRGQLSELLSLQMRRRVLTGSQVRWNDLAMSVLGRMEDDEQSSVVIR
jgi:ATP-dependent RNA helicase DHX29